ncbi:YdcF family protein [Verrucomicrobiaceae bacterium 227]
MRRRRLFFILFLILAAYTGGQLWDIHRVGYLDRDRSADCAIVLGAAAWHDKPSPVLRERLNHAIDLFKSGHAKSLLLTGGYGKGADYAESEVGEEYCVEQGVPRDKIRFETESVSTVANLKKAKEIMDAQGWKTALLVSDPWHLKRARSMATDLDITVYPSGTPSSRFESTGARAKFLFKEFYLYHYYLLTGK